MSIDDDYERRRAALDEYLADLDYDRRRAQHDAEECDPGDCEFCEKEWNEAIEENQGGDK